MTHQQTSLTSTLRSLLAASAVVGFLGVSTGATAAPVTYTIFAVTDVSLGGRHFHNAQVYLTFVGDTNDIRPFSCFVNAPCVAAPTAPGPDVLASGYQITKGKTSLLIISGRHHVRANFLPNQILVSLDTYNGGGGFGSLIGPNGLEPAYPLAIDASSIDSAPDLVTPGAYSGNAWSCIGFPPSSNGGHCSDPAAYPLKTDRGDFFMSQPYLALKLDGTIDDNFSGSLNSGIFSVVPGPTAPGVPGESGPSPTMSPFERE